MKVKLSSLISLFCLIGCLYQIHGITKSFLQFKVRRDVAYDYPSYIELPPIDIMVPMAVAMNLTQLFAAYPDEMNLVCTQMNTNNSGVNYSIDNFQEKCELNLTRSPIVVSDSLASFIKVKDIKKFSEDLELRVKRLYYVTFASLANNCSYTHYYNGLAIFLRILCLNGTKPFSVNANYIALAKSAGNLQFISRTYFGIRFSDPADLPVFEQSKYFIIDNRKSGLDVAAMISYVKTVTSSLEYLYETNCRHYNKAKSISKCLTEYSLSQPKPYLFSTLIYEWNEHPGYLGFNRDSKGNPRRWRKDGEIRSLNNAEDKVDSELEKREFAAITNCTKQATAIECEKTSYSVEGEIYAVVLIDTHVLYFIASWEPDIYLSVHPVLPLSEYLIFIGSIVGIWLSISIYDLILKMLTCIKSMILSRLKRPGNSECNSTRNKIEI